MGSEYDQYQLSTTETEVKYLIVFNDGDELIVDDVMEYGHTVSYMLEGKWTFGLERYYNSREDNAVKAVRQIKR